MTPTTKRPTKQPTKQPIGDGRRLRGDRTRALVTRHAVDVASADGLDGVSIAKLAEDLQLSKSGIATLFKTKEQLQLATVEAAGQVFTDEVIRPALVAPHGLACLRLLIERWLDYAAKPLFPGGCFWVQNLAAFDAHPGSLRDALSAQHHSWLSLLARELREAVGNGEIAEVDPDLTAFHVQSVLAACSIALQLGDSQATEKVRRILASILGVDLTTPKGT